MLFSALPCSLALFVFLFIYFYFFFPFFFVTAAAAVDVDFGVAAAAVMSFFIFRSQPFCVTALPKLSAPPAQPLAPSRSSWSQRRDVSCLTVKKRSTHKKKRNAKAFLSKSPFEYTNKTRPCCSLAPFSQNLSAERSLRKLMKPKRLWQHVKAAVNFDSRITYMFPSVRVLHNVWTYKP